MILAIVFSAMLGLIKIIEFSVDNAKVKVFLTYAYVAVTFTIIGLGLGRAGL